MIFLNLFRVKRNIIVHEQLNIKFSGLNIIEFIQFSRSLTHLRFFAIGFIFSECNMILTLKQIALFFQSFIIDEA